ncbi:MAG: hypothetical protein IT435_00510 [Phycisphaerales bacterium]|nr:hypothetical protein [Phycisphaerales bacterium]
MLEHSLITWMVVGLIAFGGALGFLHLIASLVRNETHVHDLKIRVAHLQWEVMERARIAEENKIFVDVDEEVVESAA